MNDLPCAFYESVFRVGWAVRSFVVQRLSTTAQELSGKIGTVAQQMTSTLKYHAVLIGNNRIIGERRLDPNGEIPKHLWIEKDKLVATVSIHIFENDEDKVSSEIIDRICFPNAVHYLVLRTATVSKAWIDWACTPKRLTGLGILSKLNDESIALCKKLIETGSITLLRIQSEAYSEGVMEMMKLSLTQPQFKSLCLVKDGHLEELLVFWSQNKEALRGKDLCFRLPNHVEFLEGKLELCAREKFEPIGRKHFYFPRTLFKKPSHPYKLKYGGDDGDSHSAYVFFSCVRQKSNENEMSCFARTSLIGILFS